MMQVLSVAILDRKTLEQLFSRDSLTELDLHPRNQLEIIDLKWNTTAIIYKLKSASTS